MLSPQDCKRFLSHVKKTLTGTDYKNDTHRSNLFMISELELWVWSKSVINAKNKRNKASASTSTLKGDGEAVGKASEVKGDSYGDWNVLKTLGEGTFGKVRLCEHRKTKEKVSSLLLTAGCNQVDPESRCENTKAT